MPNSRLVFEDLSQQEWDDYYKELELFVFRRAAGQAFLTDKRLRGLIRRSEVSKLVYFVLIYCVAFMAKRARDELEEQKVQWSKQKQAKYSLDVKRRGHTFAVPSTPPVFARTLEALEGAEKTSMEDAFNQVIKQYTIVLINLSAYAEDNASNATLGVFAKETKPDREFFELLLNFISYCPACALSPSDAPACRIELNRLFRGVFNYDEHREQLPAKNRRMATLPNIRPEVRRRLELDMSTTLKNVVAATHMRSPTIMSRLPTTIVNAQNIEARRRQQMQGSPFDLKFGSPSSASLSPWQLTLQGGATPRGQRSHSSAASYSSPRARSSVLEDTRGQQQRQPQRSASVQLPPRITGSFGLEDRARRHAEHLQEKQHAQKCAREALGSAGGGIAGLYATRGELLRRVTAPREPRPKQPTPSPDLVRARRVCSEPPVSRRYGPPVWGGDHLSSNAARLRPAVGQGLQKGATVYSRSHFGSEICNISFAC